MIYGNVIIKNKKRANLLLLILLVLFALAVLYKILKGNTFEARLFIFLTEASLVGGIADWFAVTALFSKPLGFGWHTALIPKNREKISNSIAALVQEDLLAKEALQDRINDLDIASLLTSSLTQKADAPDKVTEALFDAISGLDKKSSSEKLEILLKHLAVEDNTSQRVKNFALNSMLKGKYEDWAKLLLQRLIVSTARPQAREVIKDTIELWMQRETTRGSSLFSGFKKLIFSLSGKSENINPSNLAGIVQEELCSLFSEINNRNHPVFKKLSRQIGTAVLSTVMDKDFNKPFEVLKKGLIENISVNASLEKILTRLIDELLSQMETRKWLSDMLYEYGRKVQNSGETRQKLNDILRKAITRAITMQHGFISDIVLEVLSSFDDRRLNSFIEEKAGEDLQWIRINGTIVGAIAGLIIFLFIYFVYEPLLKYFL